MFESDEIELLCVKITPFKSNCPLFLVGAYHPESNVEYDGNIEAAMECLYVTNKEIILLGDINIDVLNKDQAQHRLVKYMSGIGMTQLIKEITRPASKACLDHVYTNR